MVWPVCSLLTMTGWCGPLSMMTESSRSSGTSDIRDTCQSPARRRAKLQCCASSEADGTMSWSSATTSMVLEEIWPGLPEKPFVDLKCGLRVGGEQYDQIWNWAKKWEIVRHWVWRVLSYALSVTKDMWLWFATCFWFVNCCFATIAVLEIVLKDLVAGLLYWVPRIRENNVKLIYP